MSTSMVIASIVLTVQDDDKVTWINGRKRRKNNVNSGAEIDGIKGIALLV